MHVTESTLAFGDPFLLRTAIEALADEPVELIVTTGGQRDPRRSGPAPAPPNVHVDALAAATASCCRGARRSSP